MNHELQRLEAAISTGHRASDVLRDLVYAVAEMDCPYKGFLSSNKPYCDCVNCTVCRCREMKKIRDKETT